MSATTYSEFLAGKTRDLREAEELVNAPSLFDGVPA